MSLQQIKTLYEQGKYEQSADMATSALKKNANDKASLLFLAMAQAKLELFKECQLNLNEIYKLLKKPQDDQLHYQSLVCQEQLCLSMQTSQNSSKAHKQQARAIYLQNKFQIIDFFDKKEKYDKMLEEVEVYCLNLLEDGQFKQVEENYVWLLNHQKIPELTRQIYGCRIFDIDPYYNPYTRLENLFKQVVAMGQYEQNRSWVHGLGQRILDSLDRQNCKKTVYSAIQSDAIPAFMGFCEQLKTAGEVVFQSVDAIFKNKPQIRMFARYFAAKSLAIAMASEDWDSLIQRTKSLCQTDFFQSTLGDFNKNPIQLLLHAFLDVSTFVREGRLPDAKELFFNNHAFTQSDLENFSQEFQELTPIVNIYYALCKLHSATNDEAKALNAKINQAQFLIRKVYYHKFKKQLETPDISIFVCCLKIKLATGLDRETYEVLFSQCEETFQKSGGQCSKQLQDLYSGITVNQKWQANISTGNWVEALKDLEKLASLQPERANFASVKSCQIQFQNIDQLASTPEERSLFIRGLFNKLTSLNDCDALIMQGFLVYTFPELLCAGQDSGKMCVTKWLMALKLDQTNPDLYYSLAVFYMKQSETTRASKCLDKALALRPSFEQAFVLQYHLVSSTEARLALLDSIMAHNKNIAVTYYLKGVLLQNQGDYTAAIDMFQNSIKYHTIQKQKPKELGAQLLPAVQLPIHASPVGIYQHRSQVWVHLTECFWKTDKLTVAVKCFSKFVEETSQMPQQPQVQRQIEPEYARVLEIIDWERFKPSRQEVVNDPILLALERVQPSPYILEGLMLGSRLVPKGLTSIHILYVALKCFDGVNWCLFEYLLTELLSRMTKFVQDGTVLDFGHVTMLTETKEAMVRLQKLVDFIEQMNELKGYQNLQKKQLNAMFTIAKNFQDPERMTAAMVKAEKLVEQFKTGAISRVFLLDAAKIIDECQRRSSDQGKVDDLQNRKMAFIRKAIMCEPMNPELWVHLHLFSRDLVQKEKAIFKAYELKPDNTFVQEIIIKHFLKTQQWQKAFKVLIKSYQQQTTLNEPQQPIVVAILAFLNAKGFVEDVKMNFAQKRQQLLEALSLCRLVQRDDLSHLISEMYIYLSHFSGDYVTTLKYLESKVDADAKSVLQQAYLGSPIYSYEQSRAKAVEIGCKNSPLEFVFNVEDVPKPALISETDKTIEDFMASPNRFASRLALLLETCLNRNLVPSKNLLDLQNIQSVISKVGLDLQRTLIVQSLRFIQLKEGKIPEAQAIVQKDSTEVVKEEQSYTIFLMEAARLKPQYLTQNQHKVLLRLFLQSQTDPQSLVSSDLSKHNDSTNPQIATKIQALKIVLDLKKTSKNFALSSLIKEPLSLEMNVKWVWSLFRLGKAQEGLKAFEVINAKLSMLQGPRDGYERLSMFVRALSGDNSDKQPDRRLKVIAEIYSNIGGCATPATDIDTKDIACNMVKILGQQVKVDVLLSMFKVLQMTLFEQRHYAQFNKLVKDVLCVATASDMDHQPLNEIWLYQGLNTASALVEMKKLSQVVATIKEIEVLCQVVGLNARKRLMLPVDLAYARAYLALSNLQKVQQCLNLDAAVLERDFLLALSLYTQQAYKQYYLATMGLVSGCKATKNGTAESYWTLGYAYYLKAFAEMTFLAARRIGVVLQEDFKASEGEGEFNLEYFRHKAESTLGKCTNMLQMAGEGEESVLRQAIKAMMSQI